MSNFSFIKSQRGGQLLQWDNFLYRVQKCNKEKKYWRCVNQRCGARAITKYDKLLLEWKLESKSGVHNHEPHEREIEKKCLKNKLIDRAKKEVSLSIPTIYKEEIAVVASNYESTTIIPSFESVSKLLYRARKLELGEFVLCDNGKKRIKDNYQVLFGDDETRNESGEQMDAAHKFLDFQMVIEDNESIVDDPRCSRSEKIKINKMTEARTSMIDIHVEPRIINNADKRSKILKDIEDILLQNKLKKTFEGSCGQSHIILSSNDSGSLSSTVKTYPFGLITITFEHLINEAAVANSNLETLRRIIMKKIKARAETIPAIKRGSAVPVYYTTADERILEYDFNKILFYQDSPYQNIKILHSPTLGNCLILDDLQNLADCDINYTHGIMRYGKIAYSGKDVLILGGGDGGLLHELLKEDPKFVTMVDIDQMVVDACREHLRGCCGDSLDKLEGPNYKVIIDDCLKLLDQYKNEERKFDVIINDLTDIPIATSPQGELWDFIKSILVKSFSVLKDDGSYLNHAIGEGCIDALKSYESVLLNLPEKVKFEKHMAYVPSFMENWVFYEVKKA